MLAKRHESAWLQSDFYRAQYRRLLRWLIISILLMFILIGVIIYLILFQPSQIYYANTIDGKILAMPPPKEG